MGYEGGKSIFDDFVREVRPRFLAARTFQRTIYRPGELIQCDLWEPGEQIPVGHGQRRRGWVVTCEVCWSRAIAGALIFSKEAPDILWGLARNLGRLGALPEKLVWDRESAIAAGGRPTAAFAAFCGQLEVGWVILEARDPQAKGALERSHRFMRTNFEPGRRAPPRTVSSGHSTKSGSGRRSLPRVAYFPARFPAASLAWALLRPSRRAGLIGPRGMSVACYQLPPAAASSIAQSRHGRVSRPTYPRVSVTRRSVRLLEPVTSTARVETRLWCFRLLRPRLVSCTRMGAKLRFGRETVPLARVREALPSRTSFPWQPVLAAQRSAMVAVCSFRSARATDARVIVIGAVVGATQPPLCPVTYAAATVPYGVCW
jgi:hypothetical protein